MRAREVPSPRPQVILEIGVIKLLVDRGVILICAGGGGIPVVRLEQGVRNRLVGLGGQFT